MSEHEVTCASGAHGDGAMPSVSNGRFYGPPPDTHSGCPCPVMLVVDSLSDYGPLLLSDDPQPK